MSGPLDPEPSPVVVPPDDGDARDDDTRDDDARDDDAPDRATGAPPADEAPDDHAPTDEAPHDEAPHDHATGAPADDHAPHDEAPHDEAPHDPHEDVDARDHDTHENARDDGARDGDARDESARDDGARDGDARDGDARDGDARDEDAHDEDAHDEDAHDEDAHDEDAHDEDGRDEDAHDGDAHDEDAHDEDAHDEDAHDEDARDGDAHDEDARDGDARDDGARDGDARDEDAHDEDARDEDARDEDARDARDEVLWAGALPPPPDEDVPEPAPRAVGEAVVLGEQRAEPRLVVPRPRWSVRVDAQGAPDALVLEGEARGARPPGRSVVARDRATPDGGRLVFDLLAHAAGRHRVLGRWGSRELLLAEVDLPPPDDADAVGPQGGAPRIVEAGPGPAERIPIDVWRALLACGDPEASSAGAGATTADRLAGLEGVEDRSAREDEPAGRARAEEQAARAAATSGAARGGDTGLRLGPVQARLEAPGGSTPAQPGLRVALELDGAWWSFVTRDDGKLVWPDDPERLAFLDRRPGLRWALWDFQPIVPDRAASVGDDDGDDDDEPQEGWTGFRPALGRWPLPALLGPEGALVLPGPRALRVRVVDLGGPGAAQVIEDDLAAATAFLERLRVRLVVERVAAPEGWSAPPATSTSGRAARPDPTTATPRPDDRLLLRAGLRGQGLLLLASHPEAFDRPLDGLRLDRAPWPPADPRAVLVLYAETFLGVPGDALAVPALRGLPSRARSDGDTAWVPPPGPLVIARVEHRAPPRAPGDPGPLGHALLHALLDTLGLGRAGIEGYRAGRDQALRALDALGIAPRPRVGSSPRAELERLYAALPAGPHDESPTALGPGALACAGGAGLLPWHVAALRAAPELAGP